MPHHGMSGIKFRVRFLQLSPRPYTKMCWNKLPIIAHSCRTHTVSHLDRFRGYLSINQSINIPIYLSIHPSFLPPIHLGLLIHWLIAVSTPKAINCNMDWEGDYARWIGEDAGYAGRYIKVSSWRFPLPPKTSHKGTVYITRGPDWIRIRHIPSTSYSLPET